MLVLVSFVLVLAAAVTLVVGLLQSGLTLIYLSIGCSVLAGVVLAVAVLRGRPEPRPAAAGRAFTPPQRAEVPAGVGASSSTAQTSSWSSGPTTVSTPAPPPPPPPAPTARDPERATGEDLATRAAGSALLGRLRGRRAEQGADAGGTTTPAAAEPAADAAATAAPAADDGERTMTMPVTAGAEDEDFPVPDYDRMRATELLAMLPDLDRNQLEAVRERESAGKNRFTIMSRIDALLAAKESPGWEVGDDWEEEPVGVGAESEAVVIEAAAIREEDDFAAADLDTDAEGEVEDDEVAELVSPAGSRAGAAFPIAGYETLTVGQILPRLSELDGDELAEVRAREQQGRNRGTILDRIDRLQARAATGGGAMAMPPAATTSRRRTARKAPAVSKTTAPAVKAPRTSRATKAAAAPIAMPPAPPAKAPLKRGTAKSAAAPAPAPAARTTRPRKTAAAAPVVPAPTKQAAKKTRATKAPAAAKASAKKTTKRP